MRIGVLGGTFDPVHQGHLILAEQCREQTSLDQVWFVPAARPPHKLGQTPSPFHQRVEMLALAVAGNPAFRIDDLENSRPGPSYTVDTLEDLHRRNPADQFHLVVGSDCLPDLPLWHRPVRILELAALLVASRPGWPAWSAERLQAQLGLPHGSSLAYRGIEIPQIDISSRDLRSRAAGGRSLRYLVPRSVEAYIAAHGLYRREEATT